MKTIINYMKNWRILTLGIFMNLSLILLICESDVIIVFFLTKLVGILAGCGTISIAEKWLYAFLMVEVMKMLLVGIWIAH